MSETASISLSIAGRYAQALFELAKEAGALKALEADATALDAEVASLVDGISQASRVTIETTKHQLLSRARPAEASIEGEEALLREVYTGPDFNEGVRAFLAKEKPRFGA